MVEAEFILGGLKAVLDGPAMPFHTDKSFDGRAGRAPSCEEGKVITGDVAADQQASGPCPGCAIDIFVGFEVGEFEIGPVVEAFAFGALNGGLDRVVLDGPAGVRLRSSTVQMLAMALHELATNAVKYGALGQANGQLAITWSLEQSGTDSKPWLHIDWKESGVAMPPAGSAPQGTGQGRELIERALPYQLRARTSYRLGSDGVHCTISIPVFASNEVPEHA